MYSCSPDLVEQEELNLILVNPSEVQFRNWYQSKSQEILGRKSNARTKYDKRIQLTYKNKEVDWTNFKKLNISSSLDVYEFEFLAPNGIVPFGFKEKFGYEEALERSKQTLLVFAQGKEVVKSFIARYYYTGNDDLSKMIKESNYDQLNWQWEGQIHLYSLEETHLVSFELTNGRVVGTETMEQKGESDKTTTISANITCTTTWTPGPCEPMSEGVGIVCYDTFTTYCYNDTPPLMIGYPTWSGSGGWGWGGKSF